MPNNDLISRASVLEALRELEKKMRIGGEYDSFCSGVVRATQLVECFQQAPAVTDSLSEELESLPREKCECRLELSHVNENENKWFAGYCYNGDTVHEGAWGETPLAAVLALKEALNSKP